MWTFGKDIINILFISVITGEVGFCPCPIGPNKSKKSGHTTLWWATGYTGERGLDTQPFGGLLAILVKEVWTQRAFNLRNLIRGSTAENTSAA